MRYIPHTSQDVEEMLQAMGTSSVDELFNDIPKAQRLNKPLDLPSSLSELSLNQHVSSIADQNTAQRYTSFLGAGCYSHFIPSIVNYLASQGGFLTAYTPYQPEISQGTLQIIFEFQTLIARLTGMEVANASMYDGGTSLAEACLMAKRLRPHKTKILMPANVHPEYRHICQTYLEAQEATLIPIQYHKTMGTLALDDLKKKVDADTLAIVIQTPNFFGRVEDLEPIQEICKRNEIALIVCVTEPLALAMIKPPGAYGADIVVGEAQSFGNPPAYGGPHVGFFATRQAFVRSIPGRIVGETIDQGGQRCYTLTLSTREQHIRRERATSNICTNEAWLATRATLFLSTVGEAGLKQLAALNHSLINTLCDHLPSSVSVKFKGPYFNEVVIECKQEIESVEKRLLSHNIIGGLPLGRFYPDLRQCLLVCTTELHSEEDIKRLCEHL